MTTRTTRIVLLTAVFALAASFAGFAQAPCGLPNQLVCAAWDGGSNLFASQNDTSIGGFGNFATTYAQFTILQGTWDIESYAWVGGYFNPGTQGPITFWTATFWNDNGGIPGSFNYVVGQSGTANETFLGDVNGFPIYEYSLSFPSVDFTKGSYWVSVVPDLGYPPQWGWATGVGNTAAGYQCFFGSCGLTGTGYAWAIDGTVVPEPGTLIMLATGVLGLAGTLRRKLL